MGKPTQARIKPPAQLPTGARRIWREIVEGLAADHFGTQDRSALAAYCHAAWRLLEEVKLDRDRIGGAAPSQIKEFVAVIGKLGPQLRIATSSRIDAERAGSSRRRASREYQGDQGADWREALKEVGRLDS